MNCCPRKAVEMGYSWDVALYFTTMFLLPVALFDIESEHFPFPDSIQSYSTVEMLNAAYCYPVIIIA